MTRHTILQVALPVPLRTHFDYLTPETGDHTPLKPGVRVRVPFGRRTSTGILLGSSARSDLPRERLKAAVAIIDPEPLFTPGQLSLLEWAAGYYQHPVGEVLFNALPPALRAGRPAVVQEERLWRLLAVEGFESLARAPKQRALIATLKESAAGLSESELRERFPGARRILAALEAKGLVESVAADFSPRPGPARSPTLNPAQQAAVERVADTRSRFGAFLLNGVTGSGKTEVYLELIRRVIAEDRQALLLVPEIGLTPQLVARAAARLSCPVAVIHSGLSDSERCASWLNARDGKARVILGTRSAVWTPLQRPGIIIVDEEHDQSYKQQDGFRYSARDTAVMRAQKENIPVILGSATPSAETLHNVAAGRFTELDLPERAGSATHPGVEVVDLRGRPMTGALSTPMLKAIQLALERSQQCLLFLNRRGFSPVLMCHGCGWIAQCGRCGVPMTYHKQRNILLCHHCGRSADPVSDCPECGAAELFRIGHGTQRLEETLMQQFPGARVLRIDRDTTRRKGAMDAMVNQIHEGEADILVGTQMLAKGHDFPNLALVGIVDMDQGLFSADFRGTERMAQLFVQVSGRAGRAKQAGRVVIQTHYPTHPLLESLLKTGYAGFSRALLEERREADLPPFSFMALLRAEHYETERPKRFLEQARELLVKQDSDVRLFGPVPAPMEKRAGRTRFQLLVQARRRAVLARALSPWVRQLEILPAGKRVRWSLDVDPQDML